MAPTEKTAAPTFTELPTAEPSLYPTPEPTFEPSPSPSPQPSYSDQPTPHPSGQPSYSFQPTALASCEYTNFCKKGPPKTFVDVKGEYKFSKNYLNTSCLAMSTKSYTYNVMSKKMNLCDGSVRSSFAVEDADDKIALGIRTVKTSDAKSGGWCQGYVGYFCVAGLDSTYVLPAGRLWRFCFLLHSGVDICSLV